MACVSVVFFLFIYFFVGGGGERPDLGGGVEVFSSSFWFLGDLGTWGFLEVSWISPEFGKSEVSLMFPLGTEGVSLAEARLPCPTDAMPRATFSLLD